MTTKLGRHTLVKGVALVIVMVLTLGACAPAATAPPATQAPQPTAVAPTTAATAAPTAVSNGQEVELTVWQVPNHPEMQKIMEDMVKPYAAANNVKVTIVVVPWGDLDTQWASAIQSRQTPSFGYMYDFRLP